MEKSNLGNNLKRLRRNFGFTQKQVALALHIDRSTYSYYELGKTWPDPPTLIQLANIFGLEILDLVDSEDGKVLALSEPDSAKANRSKNSSTVTNTSKIYDLPEDEQQLVLYYRTLSANQQEALLKQAQKDSESTMTKARSEEI